MPVLRPRPGRRHLSCLLSVLLGLLCRRLANQRPTRPHAPCTCPLPHMPAREPTRSRLRLPPTHTPLVQHLRQGQRPDVPPVPPEDHGQAHLLRRLPVADGGGARGGSSMGLGTAVRSWQCCARRACCAGCACSRSVLGALSAGGGAGGGRSRGCLKGTRRAVGRQAAQHPALLSAAPALLMHFLPVPSLARPRVLCRACCAATACSCATERTWTRPPQTQVGAQPGVAPKGFRSVNQQSDVG